MSSPMYKPWQVALAVVGVVGLVITVLVLDPGPDKSTATEPETEPAARDEALQAIKREPKVVDVGWEGSSLWVGVFDDGTRRDGYAAYLCEVVREANATPVTITVKDVETGVSLGRNECR